MTASDYLAATPGDLLGKGYARLDIGGMLPRDVLHCLAHNLDPATGNPLRPHARDGERVGMDFTFNAPKSVSIARELGGDGNLGDDRVEAAHREAVAYAVSHIEDDMKCRVKGGRGPDRPTGNLCAFRVTHRDTRINPDDLLPDPHLHDHVFVLNQTYDPAGERWLSAEMGDVKHDCPYYEALYHNRLACNLRSLGYAVRREGKSFEVAGVERPLIEKFSRRASAIGDREKYLEAKYGRTLGAETRAKLGATTRLGKTKEAVEGLNPYYVSRLTDEERERLGHLEYAGPGYVSDDGKAVGFAIAHEFYTKSVAEERKLYETALRHGIGSVTPEGVMEEAKRQGVLLRDGQATTRAVLAEEGRIVDFAREGKGTMRPLSQRPTMQSSAPERHLATPAAPGQRKGRPDESKRPVPVAQSQSATLSPEQQALVDHVLTSTDRVVLVVGDAGTGKTHAVRSAFDRIDCPVEMLAPSVAASRGVLRGEGFDKADTVASFLLDSRRQDAVKGGVIWVDEAGLLPVEDLSRLTEIARERDARLVLQGDPKQHRPVVRHGDMMNTLQAHAGLKVGRLTEVWRQQHQGYKRVVEDIAHGGWSEGYDGLVRLGWVREVEDDGAIVDDYLAGVEAGKDQLLIAPSHAEGDAITAGIRERLRAGGKLGEEHPIDRLVNLNWSPAERGDMARYAGGEVLVFHRNSGTFRAGEEVAVEDLTEGRRWKSSEHFGVYRRDRLAVAAGDAIRITGRGKTADGHVLENGMSYRVKGFDEGGRIVLNNGWVVPEDFGHLAHGYVSTSHAAQGRTADRVLIAMGSESRGAINAEQFYVSVSRGRQSAKVYTDLPPEELKAAIHRTDGRKSATELMTPKKKKPEPHRFAWWVEKARDRFRKLRESTMTVTKEREKEQEYERSR